MKILMIAPEPFLEPRGTPLSIYQRLQALSALGHEVDLVTYHVGMDVTLPGLTVWRIPNVPFISHVKIGPSWVKPFLDILVFLRCIQLLLKRPYDVIHSHEEAAFFALLLSALTQIPHLYDMHSSLPRQLENFKFGNWRPLVWVFEMLERAVLKSCAAVITIGLDLEEQVRQINPDVELITIENHALYGKEGASPNGVAAALRERMAAEGIRPIVYAGTFEPYQGLELLIKGTPRVRQQFPESLLVLVGGNPAQVAAAKRFAREHDLEDAVIFTGTVSPEHAAEYVEMAEVLVSPRYDGTSIPLKIYTYLHAGKPIVATRLPAHTQILSDEVARLVDPNEKALADGIIACLSDPAYGAWLGTNARNLAQQKYNHSNYISKVAQIYHALGQQVHPLERAKAPKALEN